MKISTAFTKDPEQRQASLFLVILLAAPWVNPIGYGPTPNVVQWVFACAGMATSWLFISVAKVGQIFIRQAIVSAWIVAATVSAVMGLMQYFGVADGFGFLINTADIGQAYANLRQRNHLATLLNIGLAAAFTVACLIRNVGQGRWMIFPFVILFAAANAATGSRTGFFQLCLLIAMGGLWRQDPKLHMSSAIAYLVAALVLPMISGTNAFSRGILSRVVESDLACTSRLTLWSNVLHLIAQKPWFGWGWGELDYAHFITLYPGERFCEILDNAHNLPLHLAVELGIPLTVAFCAGCTWLVWRNRLLVETDRTRQLAWIVLALIGLHSMLEYPLWYGPFQLTVVLCTYLLVDKHQAIAATTKTLLFARTVAVTLLSLCAFVTWDYWRISQIYLPVAERHAAYKEDTLAKVDGSWLFEDQVRFAELTTTPLAVENAVYINVLAKKMLHFSPEPRVVEKVIESAAMLHQDDEALYFLQRYKAAFPAQHARWSAALNGVK